MIRTHRLDFIRRRNVDEIIIVIKSVTYVSEHFVAYVPGSYPLHDLRFTI